MLEVSYHKQVIDEVVFGYMHFGDKMSGLRIRHQAYSVLQFPNSRKRFSPAVIDQKYSDLHVHFHDKIMKLCQITTNPKTNIYGAKPNSTLDTHNAQGLKWPT